MPSQAENPEIVYKEAFLKACEEYNAFGTAVSNRKLRIENTMALKLYGLKDHVLGGALCFKRSTT